MSNASLLPRPVPLRGTFLPWSSYPTWPGRYDFGVSQPPDNTPLHRSDTTSWLGREPSVWGWDNVQAYYFTAFHWRSEDGEVQTVTRDEVIQTWLALLDSWEMASSTVKYLKTLLKEPHKRILKHTTAYQQAKTLIPRLDDYTEVLFKLALGYAHHLDYLSDCEMSSTVPARWRRYDHPADFPHLRTHPDEPIHAAQRHDGDISDYPFRLASQVVAEGIPSFSEVEKLLDLACQLASRLERQLDVAAGMPMRET